MTTANKITSLRILLVPFFAVELFYYLRTGDEIHRLLAMLLFATSAILDVVDGYIARHYNQKSELGAILDPLADKLLLASAVIVLSFDNSPYLLQFPLWLTGLIIGRDLLLSISIAIIYLVIGKVQVQPCLPGKVATAFQTITILWILSRGDGSLLDFWIIGSGIFTGISGIIYIWDGSKQLSSHTSNASSSG